MTDSLPLAPRLVKGALIELTEPFLGPVPNVIVFQYNPTSFSRELKPWSASTKEGGPTVWERMQSTSQPFDPGENFDLKLEFDAADGLEFPAVNPVTVVSGVADRIAALEMLVYPTESTETAEPATQALKIQEAERKEVPVVLFVWGLGRVLPVRLTRFSVEEEAFSPTLYPVRATVTVGLDVLTSHAFEKGKPKNKSATGEETVELTACERIAVAAYKWTRGQKQVLARAQLGSSAEDVIRSLPIRIP